MTEEKKSERLVARISPEDKALIERAADLEGRSVASFTVEHLINHARAVIKEREVIRLNDEESRRLVEVLLNPTQKPSKEFREVLEDYRRSVVSDVK